MDKQNDREIILDYYILFFPIAYWHHRLVEKLVRERDQHWSVHNDVDFVCKKNDAIEKAAIVSVIFSALTLESFINYYAIDRTSKNYFLKHLDKLSPVTKWLIFPKLFTGNQISTDSQSYQLLDKLFKLRNKLVHDKSTKKNIRELKSEDFINQTNSQESIQTVIKLCKELKALDPKIDIGWIIKTEKNPFD